MDAGASPLNITDPIRDHAAATPLADAVVREDGEVVCYRDLDRAIDGIAAGLRDCGIQAGAIVRVETPNAYRNLVARLALARMGAAFAPETLPEAEFDAVLGQVEGGSTTRPRQLSLKSLWADWVDSGRKRPATGPCAEASAIFGFFPTSGTTGTPRHVAASHELIARRLAAWGDTPPGARPPRELSTIGSGTIYGFTTRLRTLWQGGAIIVAQAAATLPALNKFRASRLVIAPNALHRLLEQLPAGAPRPVSLEEIETSGALLPDPVYLAARDRLCMRITSGYGTTETGWTTLTPAGELSARPGAVGFAVPGIEIQIVGADAAPLPSGSAGALRIRGASCVLAYHHDPAASAQVFRDGWFYPGDEATIDADGMLTLVGRTSEVINKGGQKISPRVVEEVVLSASGVRDAAAFGVKLPSGVTQLWAAIVLDGDAPARAGAAAMRELCAKRLKASAPDVFLRLKEIPRNAMGKILRRELEKMALASLARRRGGAQPGKPGRPRTIN